MVPIQWPLNVFGLKKTSRLNAHALAQDTRERRDHFYAQFTNILAQMSQLELSSAGSLMPDPNGGPDSVIGPLLSMHVNELQIQGLKAIAPNAAFKTATEFTLFQHRAMMEAYRLPMSELTGSGATPEPCGAMATTVNFRTSQQA